VTVTVGTTSGRGAVDKLPAGVQLGEYVLGAPLWPLRIADTYHARGPAGPCTIFVVHGSVAANLEVRDQVIAGARAAAAIADHKHLVRTLAAGLTGDVLWIATEEIEGSCVRDLLLKKRQASTAGFGARGTANLIVGVATALSEHHHGAIAAESVAVSRTGRVRIIDLALGPGTAAAMRAGLIAAQSSVAPEILAGAAPSGPSDVYGIGALLYEALVGKPLERGGPRPSEVVHGTNSQIDEIIARACHRDAQKRFGRAAVLGEVVAEALGKGSVMEPAAVPALQSTNDRAETFGQQVPSLAHELATQSSAASGNAEIASSTNAGRAAPPEAVRRSIDRTLAAALADSTEKWLITKGRLDYGPFSLSDVVSQIENSDIVAGNFIMDKDTGARIDVGEHPLLGPMVEQARQQRDDQRRAAAEVKAERSDKKRSIVLYGLIGLAVAGAALGAYAIVASATSDDDKKLAAVSDLGGATLEVKVSAPKQPPRPKHIDSTGHGPAGGGAASGNASENLTLDLSDDSDEGSETLDMGTVYGVYSKAGGRLGSCLQSFGEHAVNIGIIIDGPSGRVTWVKVNGKQSGALYACLSGVLRALKFPSIHGPRTRAEFDIAM
jgi:serine/threonine protein kinase